MSVKEIVKDYAYQLGANLVGFGNVERCEHAPIMMSPQGLFPGSRTVISMAFHHPDTAIELGGEKHPQDIGPYSIQYLMNSRLDESSYRMATYLEDLGYNAIPIVSSNIWRYNQYKDLNAIFAPDVSHIYMAVVAGLADMGFNGLALTPEYGARNRFVTVITDADIEPDPLIPPGTVCDNCMLCRKFCPTNALSKEIDGDKVLIIEDNEYRFPNKNLWRCSWGEHFDLEVFLDIPEKVNEKNILEYIEKYGIRKGEMGQCLKFCLPANLRTWEREYSRTPVRKLSIRLDEELESRATVDRSFSRLHGRGLEHILVHSARELKRRGIDIERLLPGAQSAVTLAMSKPSEVTSEETERILDFGYRHFVNSLCYDLTRELEELGFRSYMTIEEDESHSDPMTTPNYSALILDGADGIDKDRSYGNTILTRKVIRTRHSKRDEAAIGAAGRRNRSAVTRAVSSLAEDLGADLVGVAPVSRIEEIARQIAPFFDGERVLNANDNSIRFRAWEPEIETETRTVIMPRDLLSTAHSVFVFALRYHEEVLKQATKPPAEAVGPYSFLTYVTQWLGSVIASQIVKRLEGLGYKAAISMDLLGTGSYTANPRGPQADLFSNRFAAVAAGLADLTVSAHAVTPEFGIRQRFIAIITDAELDASHLISSNARSLCDNCERMCIAACPSKAIGADEITFICEGREFSFHKIKGDLCDWTKRWALMGESGFKYVGSLVNENPGDSVTPDKLADALKKHDPIKKFRPVVAEPCVLACPYADSSLTNRATAAAVGS